jgi:hypothetical protein
MSSFGREKGPVASNRALQLHCECCRALAARELNCIKLAGDGSVRPCDSLDGVAP